MSLCIGQSTKQNKMKWGWGRKKWIVTSHEADLELPTATVLHATGKKILWSDKDLSGAVLHTP